jgi:uncharacterized membrane protein
MQSIHYFPLITPLILFFFLLIVLLIAVIEIGAIEYAYEKIGINRRYVFVLLLLSLGGSYVNIPVAELPAEHVLSNQEIHYFGMRYVVPWVQEWPRTLVAVNVGGAVIPVLLSVYLLLKNRITGSAALAVLVVTVVVHWMAEPVRGVGIAVPTFVPALIATGAAFLFAEQSAPAVAYVAGTLGTLIGADLLNLGSIQGLGAPIVSIGGAGTFDGVFVTGIIAVLLTGLRRKTDRTSSRIAKGRQSSESL